MSATSPGAPESRRERVADLVGGERGPAGAAGGGGERAVDAAAGPRPEGLGVEEGAGGGDASSWASTRSGGRCRSRAKPATESWAGARSAGECQAKTPGVRRPTITPPRYRTEGLPAELRETAAVRAGGRGAAGGGRPVGR